MLTGKALSLMKPTFQLNFRFSAATTTPGTQAVATATSRTPIHPETLLAETAAGTTRSDSDLRRCPSGEDAEEATADTSDPVEADSTGTGSRLGVGLPRNGATTIVHRLWTDILTGTAGRIIRERGTGMVTGGTALRKTGR